MAGSKKDDNDSPTMFGVSCVDGVTPVRIKFDASSGGMLVDSSTVISFTPVSSQALLRDDNDNPCQKGVSSADGKTVLPWYVNPSNGAVLVDIS